MLAIGLMSGTSMDGIDAALIETDGDAAVRRIAFATTPYDDAFRDRLRAAMAAALAMAAPGPDPLIDAVAEELTVRHAAAVMALLGDAGVASAAVGVTGFHGQTVAHRPDRRWTWQIGEGARLADLTGITTVSDFRSADVAAGGQGAPLAPGYHRALVAGLGPEPVAVLNLGGVGNITWFGAGTGDARGWGSFDTGPGNALIDDWVRAATGASHDAGGAMAASGTVHEERVAAMLDLPWFDRPGPKSLDRADFGLGAVRGLSTADGAATLTAFTAATAAQALSHVATRPARVLVTGGGRHNATLMAMLTARTGVPVAPVEAVGWNGDALEAEAFAYLAVRVLAGKPTSWPETTGVRVATAGGKLSLGDGAKTMVSEILPANWTHERLRKLTARERFRLLENTRHTKLGDESDRVRLVEAILESGPIIDTAALTSADPATIEMYELINSPDGVAACVEATKNGLPALAGIEPKIVEALGDIYRQTYMATVEAGGLVGRMMRERGYRQSGRGAMPVGSVAKTAAVWERMR